MPIARTTARRIGRAVTLTLLAALAALALGAAPAPAATKPTIVFVHGAFADASGWSAEMRVLSRRGFPVLAPANPLRGVTADAAYLRSFLSTIEGPIVLVGHSYGGVVITNAATGNPNVKALVYVAAFAPDAGESIGALAQTVPGGQIGPATLDFRPFPLADGSTSMDGYIKLAPFRRIFAADLPKAVTDVMARSQRPGAIATLTDTTGEPAWKSIPSWYLVAGRDNAVGTALERFMARRMGATTVTVKGASHAVLISRPGAVTRLVLRAVKG